MMDLWGEPGSRAAASPCERSEPRERSEHGERSELRERWRAKRATRAKRAMASEARRARIDNTYCKPHITHTKNLT